MFATRFPVGHFRAAGSAALGWMEKIRKQSLVLGAELAEGIGRLGFEYSAIAGDRPFLAPWHAFSAVLKPGSCVTLPLFLHGVRSWLHERLPK